jgi:hypothetical protein
MIIQWQLQTAQDILRCFEADIFLAFGQLSIAEIRTGDVLDAIRAVERRDALEIESADCQLLARIQVRGPLRAGGAQPGGAATKKHQAEVTVLLAVNS